MKKTFDYLLILVFAPFFISLVSSCANTPKLLYFNNIPRDTITNIDPDTYETVIRANDILQFNVSSKDEGTVNLFKGGSLTLNGVAGTTSTTTAQTISAGITSGYLVDEAGVINLPLLGEIKAAGLTKPKLGALIANLIVSKEIAKEPPIVTVHIANFRITILGEVGHPGVIPVPNEKINMLEALGEAGDLTAYANRKNLLLIREDGGKRVYKRFSMNRDQVFDKDVFYLKNQDIIYVQPGNAKAATVDRSSQLLPIALSLFSVVLVIYEVFRK